MTDNTEITSKLDNKLHALRATVGRRVQSARKAAGFTQHDLAEMIGRSVEAVSNIERGASLPPLDTLSAICIALDMELTDIISTSDEEVSGKRAGIEMVMLLLLRDMHLREAETALELVRTLHKRQATGQKGRS
ncbi:helix-turn-helix domain-containing protein [Paracoccaceae bacterium GXU_MW_L88]